MSNSDDEYQADLKKLKSDYSDTQEKTIGNDWYKEIIEITDLTEKWKR